MAIHIPAPVGENNYSRTDGVEKNDCERGIKFV